MSSMSSEQKLLQEILAFCRATGMAETTFGQQAVHEWSLVERLRSGRTVTLRIADMARTFIQENTPAADTGRRKSRAA